MSWLPEFTPADTLISKLAKEIHRRTLTVKDIWKTRSQAQYLRAQRKRTKLANNLTLLQDEDEEEEAELTSEKFMTLLYIFLQAVAMVGAKRREDSAKSETRTTDPCAVVEIPQCVLMKFFHRAQSKMKSVKPSHRLAWVQQRVEGEIEAWVDKVRNTSATMGEIIRDTFDRREAVWQIDEALHTESFAEKTYHSQDQPSGSGGKGNSGGGGGSTKGGGKQGQSKPKVGKATHWAKTLRSGAQLCQNFNRGSCGNKKNACKHGKHSCCGQQGNGRVCGQSHPAVYCTNKKVPKA
jgi:uncharacterized membrane protein YgcG